MKRVIAIVLAGCLTAATAVQGPMSNVQSRRKVSLRLISDLGRWTLDASGMDEQALSAPLLEAATPIEDSHIKAAVNRRTPALENQSFSTSGLVRHVRRLQTLIASPHPESFDYAHLFSSIQNRLTPEAWDILSSTLEAIKPPPTISIFTGLVVLILDNLNSNRTETVDEIVLNKLDKAAQLYNQRRDQIQVPTGSWIAPLSIPWLFSLCLAGQIDDRKVGFLNEIAIQRQQLPGNYKYKTVAFHMIQHALHLAHLFADSDLIDLQIALGELEFALKAIESNQGGQKSQEELKRSTVWLLVAIRSILDGSRGFVAITNQDSREVSERSLDVYKKAIRDLLIRHHPGRIAQWVKVVRDEDLKCKIPLVALTSQSGLGFIRLSQQYSPDILLAEIAKPEHQAELKKALSGGAVSINRSIAPGTGNIHKYAREEYAALLRLLGGLEVLTPALPLTPATSREPVVPRRGLKAAA